MDCAAHRPVIAQIRASTQFAAPPAGTRVASTCADGRDPAIKTPPQHERHLAHCMLPSRRSS